MREVVFVPALYTRNETIDNQHKELIKRINDLYAAIDAGEGATKAQECLEFLLDYTSYHFHAEEELMRQAQYPSYVDHKRIHDNFVETVMGLRTQLDEMGPSEEFARLVEKEFTNWIVEHIQGTDLDTIEYINNKGCGQMLGLGTNIY